jgi:hypothetical protein
VHRIFLSRPTTLTTEQAAFDQQLLRVFAQKQLKVHTVGVSDYTNGPPLPQVLKTLNTCDGACIVGYVQAVAEKVTINPGVATERTAPDAVFPSPWNQIEAGMALVRALPLFVVCEAGVDGGIFDPRAGVAFVHQLPPTARKDWLKGPQFRQAMGQWIDQMDAQVPKGL